MKEQIIEIILKYDGEPLTAYTECADEIIALFEVAEMPTEEECATEGKRRFTTNTGVLQSEKYQGFISGTKFCRNRMSSSEKSNNCTGEGERQLWRDIQEREREGFCSPAHSSPKNIDSSKTPENI